MEKSLTYRNNIENNLSTLPEKWKPRYILKRFDDDDIEISRLQRDGIHDCILRGGKFVQIREHTIMLSTVRGIDPKWENNIPPCPDAIWEFVENKGVVVNKEEIEEWSKCFVGTESGNQSNLHQNI